MTYVKILFSEYPTTLDLELILLTVLQTVSCRLCLGSPRLSGLLSFRLLQYTVWHTQCGIHRVAYTVWHTCGIHRVAYTVWHTQCGIHSVAYTVWHTQCGTTQCGIHRVVYSVVCMSQGYDLHSGEA